jgi:hypothetical protein
MVCGWVGQHKHLRSLPMRKYDQSKKIAPSDGWGLSFFPTLGKTYLASNSPSLTHSMHTTVSSAGKYRSPAPSQYEQGLQSTQAGLSQCFTIGSKES